MHASELKDTLTSVNMYVPLFLQLGYSSQILASTVKEDQGRGVQRSMLETATYYVVRMSKSASRWLFCVLMELSKKVSWILRHQQSC